MLQINGLEGCLDSVAAPVMNELCCKIKDSLNLTLTPEDSLAVAAKFLSILLLPWIKVKSKGLLSLTKLSVFALEEDLTTVEGGLNASLTFMLFYLEIKIMIFISS